MTMNYTLQRATRYAWWRALVLFGWALAPTVAYARSLRVVLLTDVEVQGDAILLSALFPASAPNGLRDAAARVLLGAAPQHGFTRRISGDAISLAIQDSGLPPSSFFVPETVTVRRTGRVLTRQEAWIAIQTFLAKHPASALRTLRVDDLTLGAAVNVSAQNPKLAVTRLTFDDTLHLATFRMRLEDVAGGYFYVTARVPSGTSGLARPISNSASSPSSDSIGPGSNILVDPRESARLHLHSADSDMLLTVQPLQRGRLGETVRVRLRASGKTLQARVVDTNSLDAAF